MSDESDDQSSEDSSESDDESSEAPSEPDAFERTLAAVRDRIVPDADEYRALERVTEVLLDRTRAAVDDVCPDADVRLAGSTARDTWISGERDVDIFVRFPPELDRETLERHGLAIGHAVLPDGVEEYAEHPYVTGEYDGFDVDLVPCYRLESATDIRSSVDRTPFHTAYVVDRLDEETAEEVRYTKAFMDAIGVYGSDLRTRGFSGYLTELLVLEYGDFRALCAAAADWQPPIRLDPADHASATFSDPLVVIDPTDPERNVAAVCSAASVARLQHHARALLADPQPSLFDHDDPGPITPAALESHLERRGTTAFAIRFPAPDLVDDQLYPQLERSRWGLIDELDRRGFDVCRSAAFADETAVLLVELAVAERPTIERHVGPPVAVRAHAEGFFDAYADDPDVYGPFLDEDRYVVEREREFTSARAILEGETLLDVRLGTHVETALESDYDVLVDDELTALVDEFGRELTRYFEPHI